MVRYNYAEKGKKVAMLKPKRESRDGNDLIKSRIGLEESCEYAEDFLANYNGEPYDAVIVDEVQFLEPEIIDKIMHIKRKSRNINLVTCELLKEIVDYNTSYLIRFHASERYQGIDIFVCIRVACALSANVQNIFFLVIRTANIFSSKSHTRILSPPITR